jgi:hypothetical protein
MRLPNLVKLVAFFITCSSAAFSWTDETSIHQGIEWAGGHPSLHTDASGRIHLVYTPVPDGATNRLYYRYLENGTWSAPQDLPGPNHKEPESDMVISPDGHVYVVGIFRVDGSGPYTVYFWEYDGTSWTGPIMLSAGTGGDESNCVDPHIDRDKNNNLHVVWSRDSMVGGEADIIYRRRMNGTWEPTQNVTANYPGTSYGSVSPDLAVDKNGNNVHVVWHDDFLNNGFQVYYTKNTNLGDPTAWLPSNQWKQLSTGNYGKVPVIFLDSNDYPNVWWIDKFGDDIRDQGYSRWNGTQWIAPQNWGDMRVKSAVFDQSNVMHMAFIAPLHSTPWEIYYRWYTYQGDSGTDLVSTGPNTNKAYDAGITLDLNNHQHIVWVERKDINGTEQRHVMYSYNTSIHPPDPASALSAEATGTVVDLTWTNPASENFYGTMVRAKLGGYPANTTDGLLICDQQADPGSTDDCVHTYADPARTWYYAAFAHDGNGHYADAAHTSLVVPAKGDFDGDNDVDQVDFGFFQKCLTGEFASPTDIHCLAADFDEQGDIDQTDLTTFLTCFSGSNIAPPPECSN